MSNEEAGYDPLQYIRDYYEVPAVIGRVVYYKDRRGVVCGSHGPHVKIWLEGDKNPGYYHPTYELTWTDEIGPLPKLTRSQKMYRAYLDMDVCDSFHDFLVNPYWADARRRAVQ